MKLYTLTFLLLISGFLSAQSKGMILLTGTTFEELGISFTDIKFELNKETWISNKLPIGKNLKITVIQPKGFYSDNGYCKPGISLLAKRKNGDTLGFSPNIMNQEQRMELSKLSKLELNVALKDQVKHGDTCSLEIVFFDLRNTNKLILKQKLIMYDSEDIKQTTKTTYAYQTNSGHQISSSNEIVKTDSKETTIEGIAYQELILEGVSFEQQNSKFNTTFTVYSKDFNEIKELSASLNKSVSSHFNKKTQKYDFKIRVQVNSKSNQLNYWNLRIENPDKKEVIDILNIF